MRLHTYRLNQPALVELLENRQLLAFSLQQGLAFEASVGPQRTVDADITPSALATDAVHIDAAAVRAELVQFADTWNGGQLRQFGTSGMGTYGSNWDGLFRMNLDRQFNPIHYYTDDQTIISQSRAIYVNVEAYRNAQPADQPRFKTAVQKGADYLLAKSIDPNTYNGNPGGMWWALQPDGVSPPTHTQPVFGTAPRDKDAYGQVQAMFALAQAYSVTGDLDHLNGALYMLSVWKTQFADSAAGPGAYLQTASENYSQRIGNRNVDYMTHALEAMLTIYDMLPSGDPRRAQLATDITNIGNFITTRMYRDTAGSTTTGYLPWFYDAQWNPSSDPAQQYMTPGHNLEMAYLLSRAVERGLNSAWLVPATKLVAFALQYAFDNDPASPSYGAMKYEKLRFNGATFNPQPENLIWWPQAEATRALAHFATVRGRTDLWDEYDASNALVHQRFVDPTYGGWFTSLNPSTFAPTDTNKGSVWTGGYHEAMLYAEQIRLAPPPAQSPFLGSAFSISKSKTTIIQAEDFDNGPDGVAYHDADPTNNGGKYRTNTGVDIESSTEGGFNVGWTRAGEWLEYTINVIDAGSYDLGFRVAAGVTGGRYHVEIDGADVTGALFNPNTGGWQNWTTVSRNAVNLPSGTHILRLALDTGGAGPSVGNFNEIRITPSAPISTQTPFLGQPFAISKSGATTIQAEDFDNGGEAIAYHDTDSINQGPATYRSATAPGVDLEPVANDTGSYNVGYIRAGEWLEYSINVADAGMYDLEFRVASAGAGGNFHLEIDGANLTSTLNIPNTFGWQSWTTIKKAGVNLAAGQHVLRLAMDSVGATGAVGNFNYIRIVPAAVTPGTTLETSIAAYVRDGDFATTNFGADSQLIAKQSTPGFSRESYIKFDLTSVASISSAKLRLFGSRTNNDLAVVPLNVYSVTDTSWSESTLTWNNRPLAGATLRGSVNITSATPQFWEVDLSGFLATEKAAGRNLVTLVLRGGISTSTPLAFNSDEAGSNRPQLVIS